MPDRSKHLPCEIVDGFRDPKQECEHVAGLGIEIDDKLVVVRLGNGQCKHRGVKIGDTLHGMNGIPMAECVKAALGPHDGKILNAETAGRVIISTPKPFTLNFNGMPDPEEAKKEMDETFMALLKQGIEVDKKHRNGNIFNMWGRRVLYMNDENNTLFVGKSKHKPTSKIFKVSDVANVGYSEKKPDQVVIQTKDEHKDVTFKLPTTQANQTFAHKLFKHCSMSQKGESVKAISGEHPLSPRKFRNNSSGAVRVP